MDPAVAKTLRENYPQFKHYAVTYFALPQNICEKAYWKMLYYHHDRFSAVIPQLTKEEAEAFLHTENIQFLKKVYKAWAANPENFLENL